MQLTILQHFTLYKRKHGRIDAFAQIEHVQTVIQSISIQPQFPVV